MLTSMTDLSICIELNASGFIILCVVSCNELLALEILPLLHSTVCTSPAPYVLRVRFKYYGLDQHVRVNCSSNLPAPAALVRNNANPKPPR